jgi:xanthine dehydrogenase YagR molybdenum-binding subunit
MWKFAEFCGLRTRLSRRRVRSSTALIGAAAAIKGSGNMVAAQRANAASAQPAPVADTVDLRLHINGRIYPFTTEARVGAHDKREEPFSWHSFGAQFAEVRVDPLLGEVRVRRVVSVHDIGRVLNAKTARSQIQGGVVWGIGMALMEHTVHDERNARLVTRNLADYLVPVNPDAPDIEVLFIDEPDPHFNALGARRIGEIGITGVAAAVANAVYHATGRRVRNLPITPEALL